MFKNRFLQPIPCSSFLSSVHL